LRVERAAAPLLHRQRGHDRRRRRRPPGPRRAGGPGAQRPAELAARGRRGVTGPGDLGGLLASLPDAVIGVRPDLTVFLWNAAAETLVGRAATRAVGRSAGELFPPDARLVRHLADTLRTGERRAEADSEIELAGGRSVPVSLQTAPIHGPAGEARGAVAVLRDLSRLKALEAEVRRGERLAALGQMALALAHEIRNPLGAIRGVAQLLAGELGDGPHREPLAVMLGEIDRVNRVMEALLDL